MWVLLIISVVGSPTQHFVNMSAISDLYSKTECREMIQLIKDNVPTDNVEYKCVYLPEED